MKQGGKHGFHTLGIGFLQSPWGLSVDVLVAGKHGAHPCVGALRKIKRCKRARQIAPGGIEALM